jgi:hypothetical protein
VAYDLQVINGSPYTWHGSDGTAVPPGSAWSPADRPLGNAWIRSAELGTLNFLDIGDTHIPGDSKETWGVLISYQSEEFVGRHEGAGQLGVTINRFGQVEMTGLDFRQVALPGFIQ